MLVVEHFSKTSQQKKKKVISAILYFVILIFIFAGIFGAPIRVKAPSKADIYFPSGIHKSYTMPTEKSTRVSYFKAVKGTITNVFIVVQIIVEFFVKQ